MACAWPWHTLLSFLDWPGSARLAITKQALRRGRVDLLQGQLATKQWTATTEVRLSDGHKGTKTVTTIAVEFGFPDCVISFPLAQSFRHYGPAAGGPDTLRNVT